MRAQACARGALLMGFVASMLGCDGTMNTGTAKKPANNKPGPDGRCPTGQTRCGAGVFAICVDAQSDPSHCGTCDRACSPGIACQAGACQQTVCTGTSIPFTSPSAAQPPVTAPASTAEFPYMFPENLLADVNGDGRLDLIAWNAFMGVCPTCGVDLSEFRVSLALPEGGFGAPVSYHAKSDIQRVFTADVNADGATDLYLLTSTYVNSAVAPYSVELWLGQKDGHLRRDDAAGIEGSTVDEFGSFAALGDLSGDGWPDLVMENGALDYENPPTLSVYLSDSTGALHLSQTFVAWSTHTLIRDMNRDGKPDLLLLSGAMEIVYNRGDGTFEQPLDCALAVAGGSVQEEDIVVDDFNRDGWMDLATEGMFSPPRVDVMLGLGGCGFTAITSYVVPGTTAGFLRGADMNGDGILDIVSVSADITPPEMTANGDYSSPVINDHPLSVLLGNGDGTFHLGDQIISLGTGQISGVFVGEVTGDHRPDVIVATTSTQSETTSIVENTCQ